MTLPMFPPADDPGPSFTHLLRRLHGDPPPFEVDRSLVVHATTIVAIRFADGVVMAGDRRATAGSAIAHRQMDKVYPADRHSGVAIAGAAGLAMEVVKLFQLQLEHYEKVERSALSLEGKANQLAQMVRQNMPMAMQGLAVLPIFGGYDRRREKGRIFAYDLTGGRYEETDYHADGSGGRDARTTVKLGYSEGMDRESTLELAIQSLYEAAEEDSATGGPDAVRGIYPVIATITRDGFERVPESDVADRFQALIDRRMAEGQRP